MNRFRLIPAVLAVVLFATGCETYFDHQRVRVIDAQENGFFEDGDELILATIDFRVRPGVPGSTQVTLNNGSLDRAATGLEDGDVKTISNARGLYVFDDLEVASVQSLASGEAPVIVGQVIVGIENDWTPRDIIKDGLEDAADDLEDLIVDVIESRSIIELLADPQALMDDLAGATDALESDPSWFDNLLLTLVSLGNADDILNFNVLVFVPVSPNLAPIVDAAFANLPEGFYGGAFPTDVVGGEIAPKQFDLRFFDHETEYIVETYIGPGDQGYVPPTTQPPFNPCFPDPPPPPGGQCR